MNEVQQGIKYTHLTNLNNEHHLTKEGIGFSVSWALFKNEPFAVK